MGRGEGTSDAREIAREWEEVRERESERERERERERVRACSHKYRLGSTLSCNS